MKELLHDPFRNNSSQPAGGGDLVLDFARIIQIIRNGWWIIALSALVTGTIAAAMVLQATPVYVARAQIMMGQPGGSSNAIENLFPELTLSKEAMAGEIALMTASRQLRAVSEKLNLEAEPEFNPALQPEGPEPGIFAQLSEALESIVKTLLGAPESTFIPIATGSTTERPITHLALAEKRELGDQDIYVGKLSQNLSVHRVGSSFLVDVYYSSTSRETAAAVPNALVDAYLAYQLEQKFGASVQMTEKLTGRLKDLEGRLEASERDLIQYRNAMLSDGYGSEERVTQQLRDLSQRLTVVNSEHTELVSELTEIDRLVDEQGLLAVSGLFDSPLVNRLRNEISDLRQSMSVMELRFGSDTTRSGAVENEIASLEKALRTELQQLRDDMASQEAVARARSAALRRELRGLEEQALELSKQQIAVAQLQRQRDANRVVYDSFLATVTEMNEVTGLQTPDAQIVSYASPPSSAASPRKKETVAISLAAGVFLGLGIVFIRSLLDKSVGSAQQLSELTGGRHVLTIPRMRWRLLKSDPLAYMLARPRSALSEAFRSLRGQLLMNGFDSYAPRPPQTKAAEGGTTGAGHKKLVITLVSATPQVGKTTTCIALARSFSEMGRSCVVIDADLRRGSIARTLAMEPYPDLVDILSNEVELGNALHQDAHSDALVVTSRSTPNDPGGILISDGMEQLVKGLSQHFDVVIIDTSPLLAVTDAVPLARLSNEVVLLARAGRSRSGDIEDVLQMLARVNVQVTSVALTMASSQDRSVHADYIQN
ncbi:GumC family protein [Sulfitobacter aestuarii]|uniref:non-specific protein-tyrosine kinase n=1 Tax=Sulfitobacter aestuarii TaxID=2161676 RepID=A0ABW5U5K7_9RHOB